MPFLMLLLHDLINSGRFILPFTKMNSEKVHTLILWPLLYRHSAFWQISDSLV